MRRRHHRDCDDLHRRAARLAHSELTLVGRRRVLHPQRPWHAPHQLPAVVRQGRIAVRRVDHRCVAAFVLCFSHGRPSIHCAGVGTTGFVLSLSWVSQVTAGHTKRITTNAIMLSAYCIGNSAGPFMWQAKYAPRSVPSPSSRRLHADPAIKIMCRNHVPWIVIGICYLICPFLLIVLRYMLRAENKRRDKEPHDTKYDDVYMTHIDEDGKAVERRVDKVCLSCLAQMRAMLNSDRPSLTSLTDKTETSAMSGSLNTVFLASMYHVLCQKNVQNGRWCFFPRSERKRMYCSTRRNDLGIIYRQVRPVNGSFLVKRKLKASK